MFELKCSAKITGVILNMKLVYIEIFYSEQIDPCRPSYGQTKIGLWRKPV